MTETNELIPCPMGHGGASLKEAEVGTGFYVACQVCGWAGPIGMYPEHGIINWNRRDVYPGGWFKVVGMPIMEDGAYWWVRPDDGMPIKVVWIKDGAPVLRVQGERYIPATNDYSLGLWCGPIPEPPKDAAP